MRETPERNRICQQALRLVAHRRLERAHGSIAEPDAWLTTTERNLRAEHWDDVVELADADDGLTAENLADMLDPDHARPSPPASSGEVNTSSRLPSVSELTESWTREGYLDAEQTKERVAAIKAALRGETP